MGGEEESGSVNRVPPGSDGTSNGIFAWIFDGIRGFRIRGDWFQVILEHEEPESGRSTACGEASTADFEGEKKKSTESGWTLLCHCVSVAADTRTRLGS